MIFVKKNFFLINGDAELRLEKVGGCVSVCVAGEEGLGVGGGGQCLQRCLLAL